MSTPHRLAKVARAWKESVAGATQAAGQVGRVNNIAAFVFTAPPVPVTARVHTTPQRPVPFSHPVSFPHFLPLLSPWAPLTCARRWVEIMNMLERVNRCIVCI
eukprot:1713749-Pyramimonas_sp.AAC.1